MKIMLIGFFVPLAFNVTVVLVETAFLPDVLHGDRNDYSIDFYHLILAVLIAPVVETVVFQYAPAKFVNEFLRRKRYATCFVIVLVSAIFGLTHGASATYMTITFFYGIVWSLCCLIFLRKKQKPILYTSLIHATYNLTLFLILALVERL